jgi:hypothetical protein
MALLALLASAIDRLLETSACREPWHFSGLNLDLGPGLRIATRTRRTLALLERAKSD